MSEKTTSSASASIAFPVASLAVFVMLIMKVGNIAGFGSVSWLWVFSPWLIVGGLIVSFLVVAAILAGIGLGIAALVDKRNAKKRAAARTSKRLR